MNIPCLTPLEPEAVKPPTDLRILFKELVQDMTDTFIKKNTDYGNSVDITYLMFGESAQLIRLWDKLLRITQISLAQESAVKSESVEDTLQDLAVYAIIAIAQRIIYKDTKGDLESIGNAFGKFIALAKERGVTVNDAEVD